MRLRTVCALAAGATILAAAGAGLAWMLHRRPERTPAMRGSEIARAMGCFACHGPGGSRGAADPTSPSGTVPDWDGRTAAAYVRDEGEIREWILQGAPRRLASTDRPRPLVPMPAYEGRLSGRELDDLVAYFKAASGFAPGIPDDAYEGRTVALRLGCFGCHGPSGMGGMPNPGSFKGHIPPWNGDEFADLVRDDAELKEWILDGRPQRLREGAAGWFLDRQAIRMPAYRDHLSARDFDNLVAYVHWLRKR